MKQPPHSGVSRRTLITGTAATAATLLPLIRTRPARAAAKTLRILQWNHFVPGYDKWFNQNYVRAWGSGTIPR